MSALEVNVEYGGGVKFLAKTAAHTIISDQPSENGGFDEGMTPPELLLASLGTCAGYYALQYLKTRNLPADGIRVSVTADKAKGPVRIGSFHIDVQVPTELPEMHVNGVSRAVHLCLIHNTLLHPPEIGIQVHAGQESLLHS